MRDHLDRVTAPDALAVLGAACIAASMPLAWLVADEAVIPVDGTEQTTMTGLESPDGILLLASVAVMLSIAAIDRIRLGRWDWIAILPSLAVGVYAIVVGILILLDPAAGIEAELEGQIDIHAGAGAYLAFFGGGFITLAGLLGLNAKVVGIGPDTD